MKNILVVDDDPDYLKLLRTMISSGSGYLVFSANNGVEADLLLESMEIDLVVTDVYMPYERWTGIAFPT